MEASRYSRGGTMRIRWAAFIIAFATSITAALTPSAAVADDGFLTTSCNDKGVVPAPADQKDVNGQLITPRAADGKKPVPVILVHGWNGAADNFTKPINLFADGGDGGSGVQLPYSFIGQLQSVAGLAVYTFDYSAYSDRWVTDTTVGPRLAQAIECLTDHYGTKAQIVAHSMGGLATRFALGQNDSTGQKISNRVSGVSTFGTPNTGSEVATAAAHALGLDRSKPPSLASGVTLAGWLLAKICGRQITSGTQSMTPPCNQMPSWAAGMDSDAARAMRVGSSQLAALPAWPKGVPVTAIDGATSIHGVTLFGVGDSDTGIPVGDLIVPSSSATAGSTSAKELTCGYSLVATNVSALFVKSTGSKLITNGPISSLMGDNPCYHANLLRTINGTNFAAAAVRSAARDPKPLYSATDEKTYSGSALDISYSFTYPAGWSVSGPQNELTISNGAGDKMVSIQVMETWDADAIPLKSFVAAQSTAYGGFMVQPYKGPGGCASCTAHIASKVVDARTTIDPAHALSQDAATAFGWPLPVMVSTVISWEQAPEPTVDPRFLGRAAVPVESGVRSPSGDSKRVVLIGSANYFSSVDAAKAWMGSPEHAQVEKLLASFRVR